MASYMDLYGKCGWNALTHVDISDFLVIQETEKTWDVIMSLLYFDRPGMRLLNCLLGTGGLSVTLVWLHSRRDSECHRHDEVYTLIPYPNLSS